MPLGPYRLKVLPLERVLATRTADEWFATNDKRPGSWWPVWGEWLAAHSTAGRVAPPALGAPEAGYAPLADAPGEYVRQR